MELKDLFQKDIYRVINGVVYADKIDNEIVAQELDEYVITAELRKHINKLFTVYGESLGRTDSSGHMGVWISGFFGSGKSHFLKIISYLFENKPIKYNGENKKPIEFFREKITDTMAIKMIEDAVSIPTDVILFNIDSLSFQNDESGAVLKAFFGVFNRKRGFCFLYPHIAHVESFLTKKGVYQKFVESFERITGSAWNREREDYVFYSDDIIKAIVEVLPNQAENAELTEWITNGERKFPLTIDNFAKVVTEYVNEKGRRLLFMVDEMGQFIGSHSDRMLNLQTIVENLGTQAQGKIWVFVTSQEDIDSVLGQKIQSKGNDYSKIQARFYTRLSLSSSSISEVIQKRLLLKKGDAEIELEKEFLQKKDILLNQLSFSTGTPSMEAFETAKEYSRSYPFVKYQFDLLQNIFDAIRSVGATGLNLSKGERSMLEAFQTALKQVGKNEDGTLVPLFAFFPTVQSFLDGSVARSIYNAQEIPGIQEYDIHILETLFLIRYLRIRPIAGNTQNLAVLCLPKVDTNMVAFKRKIDESLVRLEKENLVTRENDEFIFLTIEEQSITREIQNTAVPANREIKELAGFIFKDHFDGKARYKHSNGKLFDIQLSLDGCAQSNRGDLHVEFYSPLSGTQYQTKKSSMVITSAAEAEVLVILPENHEYFRELNLFLKTDSYLSSPNGRKSTSGEETIILQKQSENIKRRNKLISTVSELIAKSEIAIAGAIYQPKTKSGSVFVMELCEYLVESVYKKLDLLSAPVEDWERVIRSLLSRSTDLLITGANMANPLALEEMRNFISLNQQAGKSLYFSDCVKKYSNVPYGWPEGNMQVLVAYLFRSGEIKLRHRGAYAEIESSIDLFIKPSLYESVTIEQSLILDTETVTKAAEIAKKLFTDYPPTTVRELAEHIRKNLRIWKTAITTYQENVTHDPSLYPGVSDMAEIATVVQGLIKQGQDDELITMVGNQSAVLLHTADQFKKIDAFFQNQVRIWREAQRTVAQVKQVREQLSVFPEFEEAYQTINSILSDKNPYDQIKNLGPAISILEKIQEKTLVESRKKIQLKVDAFREMLAPICTELKLSPEDTYKVKTRLNHLYEQSGKESSLVQLEMMMSHGSEAAYNDAITVLQAFRNSTKPPIDKSTAGTSTDSGKKQSVAPVYAEEVYERLVEIVQISKITDMKKLESTADVDKFVEQIRNKLKQKIAEGKLIRIE